MSDFVEVSYTGDILAHRRCPRAWAYQKYAGFHPYEQVQAMEGRLIHHAMEWLTRSYHESIYYVHASREMLKQQLERHFRVLWARGIRTTFASKQETVERVLNNLCTGDQLSKIVQAIIEGAVHSEYELRSVHKVLPGEFGGKSKVLLTGILDLVIQQTNPLTYPRVWEWKSENELTGAVVAKKIHAQPNDVEIWDYKGTRVSTKYINDYIRQVLTYAALYKEKTGELPVRCVLFFVNEKNDDDRLLSVEITPELVQNSLQWTQNQVKALRQSIKVFETDPQTLAPGEYEKGDLPPKERISSDLSQQCTACGFRFDCESYQQYLGGPTHQDVDIYNVNKN